MDYSHVAVIYEFAKEHGYKIIDFNTEERAKGAYSFVTVRLTVPHNRPNILEQTIKEVEADLNSEETQKEEVNNNEI